MIRFDGAMFCSVIFTMHQCNRAEVVRCGLHKKITMLNPEVGISDAEINSA